MLIADSFLLFKDNVAAITDDRQSITYQQLSDLSEEIYKIINKRCLIFALCKNTIGSFCGYTSFLSKKIVPLLLDGSLENELLLSLIKTYHPAFIWLPIDRVKDFSESKIVYEAFDYILIQCVSDTSFELNDELALLFTTSGSTGSPKLVRISYENLVSNAESIADCLSLSKHERPITVLPMNYSYGLSVINSHLIVGATILLTARSLVEKEFWEFVKNEKATSLSGVPYTYDILKKLRFFGMNTPTVLTLTQAGGKLLDKIFEEFATFCQQSGKHFIVMYGQTEATARIAYLAPEKAKSKIGSIGKAIPGGELYLVDDHGDIIDKDNVVGELVYKGKNVSMGYAFIANDLQKGNENNGVLYTCDLARRDSQGFYYIVGRKNRFIKLFGNRVGLDEAEQLVKNIVSECACVGADDHMVIYITEKSKENRVLEYLVDKTGINRKAFFVRYIDVIPKNSSGKIIYTNLPIENEFN
jgi:long-chain acyl-CoA synthetase